MEGCDFLHSNSVEVTVPNSRRACGPTPSRPERAKRARIILLMAEGESNRTIGELVDLHYNQVGIWRKRYEEFGLAGLEDEERPGRPLVYDHDDVLLLVKLVTETLPTTRRAGRWRRWPRPWPTRGADLGLPGLADLQVLGPEALAGRVLDDQPRPGLLGQGRRCLRALPRSARTTPWCGAWTRSRACRPSRASTPPSRPSRASPLRREFEYKRNGTAVLFAALDVHDGGIAGWVTDSTRSENFVDFLGDLVRQTPKGLDLHCIADNLSAHKTGGVATFLEREPPCAHPLHAHPRQLAQPGRAVLLHPRAPTAATGRVRLGRRTGRSQSSPSSRTTTAERHRSVGPTTAARYRSRKSQ